jgi:pilus assembly protein CpaB
MKRRSWLWFVASAVLAVIAGAIAIFVLMRAAGDGSQIETSSGQYVLVAVNPIAAGSIIRADTVTMEERTEIPSGALMTAEDALGQIAARDIAVGEVIRVQDFASGIGRRDLDIVLGNDKIAVVLPADDILSQWGAIVPGDHVDVLFTLDVILESPMYPEETLYVAEGEVVQRVERDQSLDNVSVLTLQNLEVLQILEEPVSEVEAEQRGQEQGQEAVGPPQRALLLKVDPQDAVLLKYIRDSLGTVDLALRSPENGTLFDVEPVNVNYLLLRYGIVLPQPLDERD